MGFILPHDVVSMKVAETIDLEVLLPFHVVAFRAADSQHKRVRGRIRQGSYVANSDVEGLSMNMNID